MRRKIAVFIVIALIALIVGVSVFQGVLNSPTSETPHQYASKLPFPMFSSETRLGSTTQETGVIGFSSSNRLA